MIVKVLAGPEQLSVMVEHIIARHHFVKAVAVHIERKREMPDISVMEPHYVKIVVQSPHVEIPVFQDYLLRMGAACKICYDDAVVRLGIGKRRRFRFKPLPTLLFEVHGGYMFVQDEHILGYDSINTIFRHFEQDQQIVKVGGSLHYHYQDIFTMEISGDYFFGYGRELKGYTAKGFPLESLLDLRQGDWTTTSYSKPLWQVHARFDGRIDKHWSLYSDNYLVGRRTELRACPGTVAYGLNFNVPALIKSSDVTLKPYFDLNLGVEYTYNDRLAFFGQLNNYLAWNAELTPLLLYRTPSQGVNCLFGVSWNF